MGLSINYSGSFNHRASLPEMIEEVKDIAEIYKWKYIIYEEHFPINSQGKPTFNRKIYGISFTPPNCESICLCFLSNGKMSSNTLLKFYGNSTSKEEQQYLYMLWVKTQFADSNVHKLIVHLLKYLSKKYFSNFNVLDEGQYWESENEKLLEEKFKQYNDLLETISSALENYPIKAGETFEQYFKRVLSRSQKKGR